MYCFKIDISIAPLQILHVFRMKAYDLSACFL